MGILDKFRKTYKVYCESCRSEFRVPYQPARWVRGLRVSQAKQLSLLFRCAVCGGIYCRHCLVPLNAELVQVSSDIKDKSFLCPGCKNRHVQVAGAGMPGLPKIQHIEAARRLPKT